MDLNAFLQKAHSPFHAVKAGIERLKEAGFKPLNLMDDEVLEPGDYYVDYFSTTLFAFSLRGKLESNLRLAVAHTDVPTLKIKPEGLLLNKGYCELNSEIYGGMILYSWLDRPLGLAGRILLKGTNPWQPREILVDSQRPIAMIPSLAIHLNRQVNEGLKLNRQKEFIPVLMSGKENYKMDEILGSLAGVEPTDILGYDLNLYPVEEGNNWGIKNEFFTAWGLDNLVSCKAALEGFIHKDKVEGITGIALFDNEEVGSKTKQGAGSLALHNVLENLWVRSGGKPEEFLPHLQRGLMLSMDAAHGLHPNYPEYADPSSPVYLNQGVVIKQAANQAYATDGMTMAILRGLCQRENIPHQIFVNNNNHIGGSTLGSIGSTLLPMLTADVGIPLWGMHSARETMGIEDEKALYSLVKAWFKVET